MWPPPPSIGDLYADAIVTGERGWVRVVAVSDHEDPNRCMVSYRGLVGPDLGLLMAQKAYFLRRYRLVEPNERDAFERRQQAQ